jgi:hypothetical protein
VSDTDPADRVVDYTSLGLVANPFSPTFQSEDDPYWMRLVVHAVVNRLHISAQRMSAEAQHKPIVLEAQADIPDYYYVSAENAYLGRAGGDPGMKTLAVNVGLGLMRLGRIRGTLAELAEFAGAAKFDVTLAAYSAAALRDPDTTLPEYDAIADLDLPSLVRELEEEPAQTADRVFGSQEYVRLEDQLESDLVLREAYDRYTQLEPEPEETPEAPEDVAGETDTPDGLPGIEGEETVEEGEKERDVKGQIADYVIAHARAHLSPVVARAIRAYVRNGFGATAQELKVTKAPKKTLSAIIRFERFRFERVVLIYDRFDAWYMLEDEARSSALGGLSELRWAIGNDGVMVILLPKDQYPELEEQFAGALRVDWSMRKLVELQNGETGFDADLAQYWIDSASLNEPSAIQVTDPLVAPVIEASHDDVVLFAGMMALAVEDAASRGLSALDERTIAAALHRETKG